MKGKAQLCLIETSLVRSIDDMFCFKHVESGSKDKTQETARVKHQDLVLDLQLLTGDFTSHMKFEKSVRLTQP